MHIITVSFDDGFRKSSEKTAQICEQRGLSACFNVIATGHEQAVAMGERLCDR